MDIGSLLLGLALLVIVVFIVVEPIVERQGARDRAIGEADRLAAERDQVLVALRDLDFDHATGKIAADDYLPQRAQLAAQGASILQQLDALSANGRGSPRATAAAEDEIEQAIAARRRSGRPDEDRLEAEIAARRRSVSAAGVACPHCGASAIPGDKFCPKCGKAVALSCPQCSHAVRPDDRFCPQCGAKLPQAEAAE